MKLEIRGTTLDVAIYGEGYPIVFLHGLLLSKEQFELQIPALSSEAQLILIDMRSHGESLPWSGKITLEEMVEDLWAVLEALHISQCGIAGLSMGGMIAMRAALKDPQKVQGLFLMNTSAHEETWKSKMRYQLMLWWARRTWPSPKLLDKLAREMFGRTYRSKDPEFIKKWKEMALQKGLKNFEGIVEAVLNRKNILEALDQIQALTKVVVGDEDRVTPAYLGKAMASRIKDAELIELSPCGHISTVERAEEINHHLLSWIDELKHLTSI